MIIGNDEIIKIKGLKTYFHTDDGVVKAVDGVDFDIRKGETMGLVGESACGKTVTSFSIMRLVESPPGKIEEGEVLYKGENLLKISQEKMRKVRGNEISMIFQEPMTSLNPVFTIGKQLSEVLILHQNMTEKEALDKSEEMIKLVGIPRPREILKGYPHELSGGMRQRVMIAMALSCKPGLLIADEPTTALDVTIQAQILELIKGLQESIGMAVLFITHDLGVIAEVSDRVAVMYAGKIQESGTSEEIFIEHIHPYTEGLLKSIPMLNVRKKKLDVIEGSVPDPINFPPGCKFHPRCKYKIDKCEKEEPELLEIKPGHFVRCWVKQ
ncbi:MAG: ABC transporter ATP-binding protein [Actinobacteria bacterium]|nr:ABC transporter ATP-binding protein [Actinomycetota bacterium]